MAARKRIISANLLWKSITSPYRVRSVAKVAKTMVAGYRAEGRLPKLQKNLRALTAEQDRLIAKLQLARDTPELRRKYDEISRKIQDKIREIENLRRLLKKTGRGK